MAFRNSFKILLVATSAFLAVNSAAQELPFSKTNKFTLGRLKFEDLPSPQADIGFAKRFKQKDWLEIEVPIKTNRIASPPVDQYLDQFKVHWYVVVKGQDNKGYMMEKTVTHVNLPMDEEVFVSIYLSPNTMRRITGKEGASKADIEAIGGEVEFSGELVGFFAHGAKDGWWRQPLKNIERTNKFPLLTKQETPFAPFWYDRYAEILPEEK